MAPISRVCRVLPLVLILAFGAVEAATVSVPAEYPDLQAALAASASGDSILLAPGSYAGAGNRALAVGTSLAIIGTGGAEATLVDCEGADRFLLFAAAQDSLLLQGLTLANGRSIDSVVWEPYYGVPDVSGATIRQIGGRAIYRDLVIHGGNSDHGAGGFSITKGYATVCSALIEDCRFVGCRAARAGGAVLASDAQLRIVNSIAMDNFAQEDGGAIAATDSELDFIGVTLVDNESWAQGSALRMERGSTALERCIVAYHRRGSAAIWQSPDANDPGALTASCSDFFANTAGSFGGIAEDLSQLNGNISVAPGFCDVAGEDLHLAADSPCLPAGNPCGVRMGAHGEGCPAQPYLLTGTVRDANGHPVAGVRVSGGPAPAISDEDGNYTVAVPAGWGGLLLPSSPYGTQFAPPAHALAGVSADQFGLDFAHAIAARGIAVPGGQPTIRAAISLALPGDSVLVAPGSYLGEGFRDISLQGKAIHLRGLGGSTATELALASPPGHRAFAIGAGEGSETLIEGFRIAGAYHNAVGAAMLINRNSSPVLRDLHFVGCQTYGMADEPYYTECYSGGAIYVAGASSPRFDDLRIEDCSANCGWGGALFQANGTLTIVGADISGCRAVRGGAFALYGEAASIEEAAFHDNIATIVAWGEHGGGCYGGVGGAIHAGGGAMSFRRCSFTENRSQGCSSRGGAIFAYSQELLLEDCLLAENRVPSFDSWGSDPVYGPGMGGALWFATGRLSLRGTTFWRNSAATYAGEARGGAISLGSSQPVTIERSIIGGSLAGGGLFVESSPTVLIACCDAYANAGGDYLGIADPTGENGNFRSNPSFCDADAGDFTLYAHSPCAPAHSPCGQLVGAFPVNCIGDAYYEISGVITTEAGAPAAGVPIEGGLGALQTGAGGEYSLSVPEGWSGVLTPVLAHFAFDPPQRSYTDVQQAFPAQDFIRRNSTGPVISVPVDFATLQAALDYALPGDTILLEKGSYAGAGFNALDFRGKPLVVAGRAGADSTFIDVGAADWAFHFHTGESTAAQVRGLTVRNATNGRAIVCEDGASPTLADLVIEGMHFTGDFRLWGSRGQGLYVGPGCHPVLMDIAFRDCRAAAYGGAICVEEGGLTATRLVVENCQAGTGGAVALLHTAAADVSIDECLFLDNWAVPYAAGGYPPGGQGGGLFLQYGGAQLRGCTFHGNGVEGSVLEGGSIFLDSITPLTMERCIVANTAAGSAMHASYPSSERVLACNDFFNPGVIGFTGYLDSPIGHDGNLGLDPLFCAAAAAEFGLDALSPCAPGNNACGVLMGAFPVSCQTPVLWTISGHVHDEDGAPLPGIEIVGAQAALATDAEGAFSCLVPEGWTGELAPVEEGRSFEPASRSYAELAADQLGQDFQRVALEPILYTISGHVHDEDGAPLPDIEIAGLPAALATDGEGAFAVVLPAGWSGELTPVEAGRSFEPASRSYEAVAADTPDQDFQRVALDLPPDRAFLAQNQPNPCRGTTTLAYGLPAPARLTIAVLDIRGRFVCRLLQDRYQEAGLHTIVWDGRSDDGGQVPSGVYLCRLELPGYTETRKLVLLR